MSPGDRTTFVLRPARRKALLYLLLSLPFTGAGVAMIVSEEGIEAWFAAVFFGLCSAVFAVQLMPAACYLRLTPDGFIICTLFRKWPLIRWNGVSEFRV